MNLNIKTDVLIETVDLEGLEIDKIDQYIQTQVSPTDLVNYRNIRFKIQGGWGERVDYDIVGDRLETPAEAKSRIDKSNKMKAAKRVEKQNKIKELEDKLRKLKGVK